MAASFSNCVSLLLFTTLFWSLQVHARDSQFFSKATHVTTTLNTNNNNVKETEFPNKEEPVNKPEQQPAFIPDTESNYGLYGHESGQLPPATTTTTHEPYKTESEEHMNKYPNSKYYNNDAYNTKLTGTGYSNNNNNYYKKDAYGGNQNEFNSMENQNNNQKYFYDNNNAANDRYFDNYNNNNNNNAANDRYFDNYNNNNNAANDRYYNNNAANNRYDHNNNAANNRYYNNNNNAANNRYNGERQGMSDTRYLEGGKYYYDVNSEKYNPTLYSDSSRGVNFGNWENNRGYFGNNNGKSYENRNSFEGYQNQEEFEDEQEDFEP